MCILSICFSLYKNNNTVVKEKQLVFASTHGSKTKTEKSEKEWNIRNDGSGQRKVQET